MTAETIAVTETAGPPDPTDPTAAPTPLPAGGREIPRQPPGEIGGKEGPEPTRFGDWENKGRCTDF
jgi:hypothetical protein